MWYRYLDDFRRGISVFAIFSYGIGYPLPLCPSHIDHDVLTAHCRASSGDSVDFLSQTICTITVAIVIGVSQTSFMVGGFQYKALLALWSEETDPSEVCCGGGRLPIVVWL